MKPTSLGNPSSFEWLRTQLEEESRPQRKQPPLPSLDDMTRLFGERKEICREADNTIKRTIEMLLGAGINPVQFIHNAIRKYCPEFIDTLAKTTQYPPQLSTVQCPPKISKVKETTQRRSDVTEFEVNNPDGHQTRVMMIYRDHENMSQLMFPKYCLWKERELDVFSLLMATGSNT